MAFSFSKIITYLLTVTCSYLLLHGPNSQAAWKLINIHLAYLSFCGLRIGRLQQTKGEGHLIGCFMNEPRRYQTYTIRQLDLTPKSWNELLRR